MNSKQTAILVLGMHRSGTSALTGVLSHLDIYLGEQLLPPHETNKKGFFENRKIVEINEKILKSANSYWHDVLFTPQLLDNVPDYLKQDLEDLIVQEFSEKIFAIKDPRICYLFPLYEKILNKLRIDIKILIPFRNPYEVAMSLHRRNGFSIEKGIVLWLKHIYYAYTYTDKFPREIIYFDDLLRNPKIIAEKLTKITGKNFIKKYNNKKEIIDSFLESELKTTYKVKLTPLLDKIFNSLKSYDTNEIKDSILYIEEMINYFYHKEIYETFNDNKKKIHEQNNEIDKLNFEIDVLKHKIKQNEDKIKNIKEENNILKNNQKVLNDKYQLLLQQNQNLKNEIAMYYLSDSWKFTRPIRKIIKKIKG